jgi:hypothetical protein
MKLLMVVMAAVAIAAVNGGKVHAGSASDAFGKCVVESSMGKDRLVVVKWFFAALSANPNVQSLAAITPEQRAVVIRQAADVIQRLTLIDCHSEAVAAIRQDGSYAMRAGFEALGKAAAMELMSDPTVTKQLSAVNDQSDMAKWNALLEEAKKSK